MQQTAHAEHGHGEPPPGLVIAPDGLRAAIVGSIAAIGFRGTAREYGVTHAALARLRDGRYVRRSTLLAASLAFGVPAPAEQVKP